MDAGYLPVQLPHFDPSSFGIVVSLTVGLFKKKQNASCDSWCMVSRSLSSRKGYADEKIDLPVNNK